MDEHEENDVAEQPLVQPLPYDPDGEILDWDAYIPPPPPLRRGTIQVRLRYKGRGQPLPCPDPDEE